MIFTFHSMKCRIKTLKRIFHKMKYTPEEGVIMLKVKNQKLSY